MSSVLFDEPGPRARRRTRIATGVAAVVVLGLVALAVQRFASTGQFDAELWAPLLDPRTERVLTPPQGANYDPANFLAFLNKGLAGMR